MTTTDVDKSQLEQERAYQAEFPGFDPVTWAAMAYYSKGYPYTDVRLLLAKRFGDAVVAKRDALVKEVMEAGSSPYQPPDIMFEIEELAEDGSK
jgi:hypothetical protein